MKFSPNDVLTRLTQDIVSVKSFLFDFLHNSFFQGIMTLGILTVLFFLNLKAGIIITMLTVAAFISSYFGSSYLNNRAFVIRQIASKFTHLFQIGISYPFLNFSWNLFSSHLEKYKTNAQEMRKEQVAFVNQIQLINQSISFVNLLIGTVFLFFVLRSDLHSGLISIGGMFSIIMYSSSVIQATTSLAASIVSTKLNRVSVLRINELQETSNTENTPYYKLQEIINHPFFKNELQRGFLLPDEDNYFIILNSSNGSGKSTLAHVLTGFDDIAEKVYQGQWFLLPSEPVVFEGSLLDNIRLISGRMLSPEEIYRIISDNDFGELLALFPNGIHSGVSATSVMVSRGQKQAVGLIAAIIKDPTAIVIDEGLNSLDSVVKSQIKDPLLKWLKGRKAIFIDHEKLYTEQDANTKFNEELSKVID
jgi:ABC-type bacteriocin/lantibiotic exporter with double-glycine peptidase domain